MWRSAPACRWSSRASSRTRTTSTAWSSRGWTGTGCPTSGQSAATSRSELLGRARALLHLIDFEEPFGFSVVEAMACGTPVIANARGSMPEIIRDGENGFLVSGTEQAVAAVHTSGSVDRLAVRASVRQRFDVERMVDEYLAVYHEVVRRHRTRSGLHGPGALALPLPQPA